MVVVTTVLSRCQWIVLLSSKDQNNGTFTCISEWLLKKKKERFLKYGDYVQGRLGEDIADILAKFYMIGSSH